jgi:hypothetical protein
MKKTFMVAAAVMGAACGSNVALALDTFNGRLTGMSGAGYVTGNYADGVLLNPSLLSSFGEREDVALVINGGAMGADPDDLLEGLDELVSYLDYLQGIQDVRDLDESMIDETVARLRDVDGKPAYINGGGSLVLAIPSDALSVALVADMRVEASVRALVDENDYTLIENSLNRPFRPEDMNSSVLANGVMVAELGLAFSKKLDAGEDKQVLVGVTPKYVTVESFVYNATVDSYDEESFDADQYTRETTLTNLDAGVTYVMGPLRYGMAVKDVLKRKYTTITGETVDMKPVTTAAVGYQSNWLTLEAALDLQAAPSLALNQDSRMLRAGAELNAWRWVQVRVGMQKDMEDALEDTYSVGLGLSPFDTINLDVAAVKGNNEATGVAMQLGLRF